MSKNKLLILGLGLAMLSTAAQADPQMSQIFTGYAGAPDSNYGYIGDVIALNKDISQDGVLFRTSIGYGEFSYSRPHNAAGGVNADMTTADIMLGYQVFFHNILNGGRFTLYGGGDYQDFSLNKVDTLNPVRGTEWGGKALGELRLNLTNQIFTNIVASYSGAFDTYWTNERVGYYLGPKFLNASVGPEVVFLGDKAFDQQRVGAFIGDIHVTDTLAFNVSGGYENSSRRGEDGGYGDISLTFNF